MELMDKQGSYKYENTPKYDGTQNSPKKGFMIVFFFNLKVFKDKQDHEDIIHR